MAATKNGADNQPRLTQAEFDELNKGLWTIFRKYSGYPEQEFGLAAAKAADAILKLQHYKPI